MLMKLLFVLIELSLWMKITEEEETIEEMTTDVAAIAEEAIEEIHSGGYN